MNMYLVSIPVPGTQLLKHLKFPKQSEQWEKFCYNFWSFVLKELQFLKQLQGHQGERSSLLFITNSFQPHLS